MRKKYQFGLAVLLLAAAQVQTAGAEEAPADAAAPAESSAAAAEAAPENGAQDAAQAPKQEDGDEEELDDDGYVFGYRNGYLHASVGLTGEWTDNLYNESADEQDNFLTQVSPSIWFTSPRRPKHPIQIAPDNTAPGGMQYSLADYDEVGRHQLYLAGNLDYMNYSSNSDLNHVEGDLSGLFQFKPGSRLVLRALDKYTRGQDVFNMASATAENERIYDSNIFGAGGSWQFADKFSLELNYQNFLLEYDEEINDFMNRTDHGFDGSLVYEHSPKTDIFLEYQYLLADYDEDEMPDNDNTYVDVGVNWQATVKTSLMAKAGYQQVDYEYEDSSAALADDSESGLHFEVQGIWKATHRSSLLLNTKYGIEQSDTAQAQNKTVFAGRVAFDHRFTDRIRGDVNLVYENSDYGQFDGSDRTDDRWYLKPELQYALKKWLYFNVYCSLDKKDSTFDGLDYDTATVGIGFRGSL
jgi:hypothetical protein